MLAFKISEVVQIVQGSTIRGGNGSTGKERSYKTRR